MHGQWSFDWQTSDSERAICQRDGEPFDGMSDGINE